MVVIANPPSVPRPLSLRSNSITVVLDWQKNVCVVCESRIIASDYSLDECLLCVWCVKVGSLLVITS